MAGMLAALALAATVQTGRSIVYSDPRERNADGSPFGQKPDNRGRRAEKDAEALAKAEAKRQRKNAKRLRHNAIYGLESTDNKP